MQSKFFFRSVANKIFSFKLGKDSIVIQHPSVARHRAFENPW